MNLTAQINFPKIDMEAVIKESLVEIMQDLLHDGTISPENKDILRDLLIETKKL